MGAKTTTDDILLALKAIEDCPVRGHLKMIDGTRFVFLGEDPAAPNTLYLAFRSADNEDTKIALSKEAIEALKWLLNEPFKGKKIPFPYTLRWQVQITEEG